MSTHRHCSRPGCNRPAEATLTYAYADSTVVVGPLATVAEPHSWDLCSRHAERITAPVGWELVRVQSIDIDDEELFALATAVREGGRVTTGLVEADPIDFAPYHPDPIDPAISKHPVHRSARRRADRDLRRAHLHAVPDLIGD